MKSESCEGDNQQELRGRDLEDLRTNWTLLIALCNDHPCLRAYRLVRLHVHVRISTTLLLPLKRR